MSQLANLKISKLLFFLFILISEKTYSQKIVLNSEAQFSKGNEALGQFINKHFKLSKIKFKSSEKIPNKILMQINVLSTGKVVLVKVYNSKNASLFKECQRLIQLMPKWKPLVENGVKQDCLLDLPIFISEVDIENAN